VASTSNEFNRGDTRSMRDSARETLQQAGATGREEVQNLLADVEDLIDRVGEAADPEIRRLRAKVVDAMASTRRAISQSAEQVQRQAREAFEVSDRYVRNQPWEAIGIAAIAGIAVGYLVSRRN